MTTSASTAAISLVRKGARSESRLSLADRLGRAFWWLASTSTAMTGPALRRREPQHVPDASKGVDQPWLLGVDLAPEHRDVGLDDPGVTAEVVVPDVVEDLHLRQHAIGVGHEVTQQLELGRRKLHLRAAPPDLMALFVKLKVRELQPGRRLHAVTAGPPQHGLDPGDDLFKRERLCDVVVAAERESADLVVGSVPRGQEHDGGACAAA